MGERGLSCDVCEGLGVYPIYDRHSRLRYWIVCPECELLTDPDMANVVEVVATEERG